MLAPSAQLRSAPEINGGDLLSLLHSVGLNKCTMDSKLFLPLLRVSKKILTLSLFS